MELDYVCRGRVCTPPTMRKELGGVHRAVPGDGRYTGKGVESEVPGSVGWKGDGQFDWWELR